MIKNSIDKLYIGITQNPKSRTQYHNEKRGAKFTKYKSDFKVVFYEEYKTLAETRQREIQIKKWRRDKKETLIQRFKQRLPTKVSEK